MNRILPAMLAVAISLVPLGAFAGEPSAPAPMPPMPMGGVQLNAQQHQAMIQIMVQSHQQLEQLHAQARAHILSSLTPAHRALLAQVVGNLAISPNPDMDAAARQLDAALSPAEAQAITTTHEQLKTQARAIMENAHKQMEGLLSASQRSQMDTNRPQGADETYEMHGGKMDMHEGPPGEQAHTAGMILLELSTMGEGHEKIMLMGMPHP